MQAEAIDPGASRSQRTIVLSLAALTIITAGSFATLAGLLTTQFASQLGWSPASTSPGVAINMILYGATAPFAIHAMEKYGIRRITIAALLLLIIGALFCLIPSPIVFNIAWGLIVGLGCGALTMAFGALIARTWFQKTGLATGILTASAVTGQFVLLPLWALASETYGWRASLIGCSALAVITILANLIFFNERYTALETVSNKMIPEKGKFYEVIKIFLNVAGSKSFWLIVLAFAMCGATTNGLMWSNFIPAASDHNLDAASASTVLLLIGIFNIPGTIFAGWLSDRLSQRLILAVVFAARGATLLWLPLILASELDWKLVSFGILFGIFDVATVPPVINLCNRVFGDRGPSIFSWVNVFHQVGAGSMTLMGSGIKLYTGSFFALWIFAGAICLTAIMVVYSDKRIVSPK